MNNLYAGCDCHGNELPNLSDHDGIVNDMMQKARQLWKQKGLPEGTINRDITRALANTLWDGVVGGYGNSLYSVDYNTPDWNMLAKLQQHIWSFAAAKNYQELRELSFALIGEDGKLRSYKEFMEVASSVIEKYEVRYLKTEYNLAVAGGQMAGKWVDIQKNKDTLPYLQFDAVLDGQTTNLCKGLHKVTLPVDHSFWSTYYPPNHFNCRSTVRQLAYGTQTLEDKIPAADIPDMFKTNLGEKGLIFPKNHSYWEGLPESIKSGALSGLRNQLIDDARSRLLGKTVDVPEVGTVSFSGGTIKKMFSQGHTDFHIKNQLVPIADLLLKNSEFEKKAIDVSEKGKLFYYLKVKGAKNLYLNVRLNHDNSLVLYSITDSIK